MLVDEIVTEDQPTLTIEEAGETFADDCIFLLITAMNPQHGGATHGVVLDHDPNGTELVKRIVLRYQPHPTGDYQYYYLQGNGRKRRALSRFRRAAQPHNDASSG